MGNMKNRERKMNGGCGHKECPRQCRDHGSVQSGSVRLNPNHSHEKQPVIALAGNPNSGKTTIFNYLVGAREKVGNWPGTTVEKKEGMMYIGDTKYTVVDLPGIYSLNVYSIDEKIARDFLMQSLPSMVLVIIDASNIERNLNLVIQLLEMGENVVLVLNMMDMAKRKGMEIQCGHLSKLLQIPVIPAVALRNQGLEDIQAAIEQAFSVTPQPLHIDYTELEQHVKAVIGLLGTHNVELGISHRSVAVRLMEHDQDILTKLRRENAKCADEVLEYISSASDSFPDDIETWIVERRYGFIHGVAKESVKRHLSLTDRVTISDTIDRILTHKVFGIPLLILTMYLLFSLVFKVGDPFVGMIDGFFQFLAGSLSRLCESAGVPGWIGSLVSDGIVSGVGSVLVFIPYIVLLFLGISFLEDTGYLARAAFLMDRMMHALGLHGKSFIPMLLGFGCNIPGIMATRTLESPKDRILTILILPMMSCSARLPVYTLFVGALFEENQGLILFSLYIMGIVLAIIMAQFFKRVFFKEDIAPLVMELPPYRLPNMRNIILHVYSRAAMFIKKAGTVILFAVICIWTLASLPVGVEYGSGDSIIGIIGRIAAPIFAPAGFGFWQAAVSLFTGIFAKEVVVSTLGTLYEVGEHGLTSVIQQNFTPLSGYAFLIMTLTYIPCIPTIAVIKKETNWGWTILAVVYTLVLGWVVSVAFYQCARLIAG